MSPSSATIPLTTVILWDGDNNGVMFLYNAWYARVGRITLDGKGKALTAIRHGPAFTTYNEFSDMVFRDVGFGIEAGMKDGIAETTVWRCQFLRCTKAGISIQNFNSLDWFIWDCRFEDCNLGVTNSFGAGNFHVYQSLFRRSTQADMSIGNTCYFGIRDNTSVGSKAFFTASPMSACSNLTIQGNTIIDCQDIAIRMQDMGPLLLFDNTFAGRKNPAVQVNPKAGFVSAGNTFTAENAVQAKESAIRFDDHIVNYDTLRVTAREPPGPLPRRERPVIELSKTSTTADIQQAIEKACTMKGRRPVIHLPAGTYSIRETLVIPAGCDVQIVGDGCDTILHWAAKESAPVLRLAGPVSGDAAGVLCRCGADRRRPAHRKVRPSRRPDLHGSGQCHIGPASGLPGGRAGECQCGPVQHQSRRQQAGCQGGWRSPGQAGQGTGRPGRHLQRRIEQQ